MHRHTRSEAGAGDLSSPRSSRAASFSSDRPSVTGSVTFQMPLTIRPAPAYIAASVASQTVTDHHKQSREPAYDSDNDDPSERLVNALFSEQALCLLNAFLDHLLFAFLFTARSPSLTAIRPAITEVLKPRLAREAMATADEELQGLLAGEDDEEFPLDGKAGNRWDVEKVWKRTRLRIMVYTRLGELEDEDEERYVQQERGLSMDENDDDEAGLVSWASAIFLTSVVEYVAEQTLLVSGQAAFARMAAKMKKAAETSKGGEDQPPERIIVEDFDVEKVALNSALGRLWRTWRKRVRSPIKPLSPSSRGPRYMSSFSSLHRRRVSHDTVDEYDDFSEIPEYKPTETEIAANIPLPISDNDVAEIEVPGLAQSFEEIESSGTETPVARPQRPSSFIMLAPADTFRRRLAKQRPLSMPPPDTLPFVVPPQSDLNADEVEPDSPIEKMSDDESYIMDERQEGMSHTEGEDDEDDDDADMVAFAASTGMGFGMGPGPIGQVKTSGFSNDDSDSIETPTQKAYTGEPQVLLTKRMSIKESGPPGIVRTYSTRSSASSSTRSHTPRDRTPSATPRLKTTPFIEDDTREDMSNPHAIGVAHTSNVPIAARPSPPLVAASRDQAMGHTKQPALGGYVEVLPRNFATSSTAARGTPSPERTVTSDHTARHAPEQQKEVQQKQIPQTQAHQREMQQRREMQQQKEMQQQREMQRQKEMQQQREMQQQKEMQQQREMQQQKEMQQQRETQQQREIQLREIQYREAQRKDPPRQDTARKDTPSRETRNPALAPVQEFEPSIIKSQQSTVPQKLAQEGQRGGPSSTSRGSPSRASPPRQNGSRGTPTRDSPSRGSPNPGRSVQSRETPMAVPERSLKHKSLESASRSRANTTDTIPENKSGLKRLSSSSSTGRSVSTSILHSARDSDVSIGGRPRGLSGRMSEEDRERQFDTLVKGEETVKFTLTPQTVRDIDEPVVAKMQPEAPKDVEPARPSTATVTVYPRVNADKDNSFGSQHLPSHSVSRTNGPTVSPGRTTNRAMLAKPLAREPRIQSESMRDFADFIRSTGPSGNEERPVQPFVSFAGTGNRSANGSTSSLGGLARKLSTKQTTKQTTKHATSHSHSASGVSEGPSAKPRVHMEPRNPAGQRTGNDDLIDFIRQGPPGSGNGQHRIPRNVAPFRSTVDSDQFERMLDENSNVESNYGSQVSTTSKQSTHTTNSRTGLLPAANVVQPAYSNAPQKLSGSLSNPEPHIQRTRRRVKDPYAIDLSDDEDDDLLTALPKPARREESLMDFLNSMEPPPSNEPKPLVLNGAVVAAARARIPLTTGSPAASMSSPGTASRNGATQHSGKPFSMQSSPISSPSIGPPQNRGPRAQARVAGAREATVGRSATNDLADFLRNSGPPEPVVPRSSTPKEETKRRFWRKKGAEKA